MIKEGTVAMTEPVKDVASKATEGTVSTPTPATRFRQYMLQRAQTESAQSGEDVSANQIDKVFAADDADSIFAAVSGGTVQARDAVGLEVEIHSMRMQESDRYEGSPYYANLDVTVLGGPREVLTRNELTVGESAVLQTGAEIIIAMVRAFEAKELLPIQAVIAGTETSSGFTVLKLARMPERTAGK
jgi:hypothetical protein